MKVYFWRIWHSILLFLAHTGYTNYSHILPILLYPTAGIQPSARSCHPGNKTAQLQIYCMWPPMLQCSAKATASHQSRQYNCALYFPLRVGNSLQQLSGKKMHTSLIRRMHIRTCTLQVCPHFTKTKTSRRPSKRPPTSGRPKGDSVNMVLAHAREVAPAKISEAKLSSTASTNTTAKFAHVCFSLLSCYLACTTYVLIVCACAFNSLDR